jgi:hypothetical protein
MAWEEVDCIGGNRTTSPSCRPTIHGATRFGVNLGIVVFTDTPRPPDISRADGEQGRSGASCGKDVLACLEQDHLDSTARKSGWLPDNVSREYRHPTKSKQLLRQSNVTWPAQRCIVGLIRRYKWIPRCEDDETPHQPPPPPSTLPRRDHRRWSLLTVIIAVSA